MLAWGASGRPEFKTVEEMDETLVERWNSVVKPGDKVYHLGDVFMGNRLAFAKLWPRLNGRKVLIGGNHDPMKWLSVGGFFKSTYAARYLKDWNIHLSHIPMHESSIINKFDDAKCINVHGHLHRRDSPEGPYYSVCVERHNYTPVAIDDLLKNLEGLR
jgi:calcineurin-like phosphoesterase family protein